MQNYQTQVRRGYILRSEQDELMFMIETLLEMLIARREQEIEEKHVPLLRTG